MKRIESLIHSKRWSQARSLLQEELVFAPSDHWIWMTLSLTYHEEKEHEKALACSKRALELATDCPLALWHYAGCLYMSGEEHAAAAVWSLLLGRDLEEIAYDDCGEGMDWALQLINDVHYRMGRYFHRHRQSAMARTSFEKYLHNRAHGVGSIYDERDVREELANLG